MQSLKQFGIFFDPYYWRTALLITKSTLVRQYRNSYLGMVWTLLQPLTMVMVYAIVMPVIMRFPARDYVVYILCTLPLWGFISGSLIGSSQSLIAQGETLKRCIISSTTFPIADVLRHLYTYCIAFTTMYCVALMLGFQGTWYTLLVPVYLIPIVITILALAIGIAFIAPYIRDIGEALMVGMNVMLWFSAVPYPASAIPDNLRTMLEWNPFYILLHPIVILVYEHELPGIEPMAKLFGLMLIALAVGFRLYKSCRQNFVYYL